MIPDDLNGCKRELKILRPWPRSVSFVLLSDEHGESDGDGYNQGYRQKRSHAFYERERR
jgi:hypothetical protein